MSENRIFVAAGGDLNCGENSWPHICKEKLNCELHNLTEEKIGNALISRKLIYKINELVKTHNTDDIIVGVMWNTPNIHERYIDNGKNDEYVRKPEIELTSVVEGVKNWRVLNHEWISSSEDTEMYFKVMYDKIQSYVFSIEHMLRTQWYLKKLGIKYFMTSHIDLFYEQENYLKMYDFKKLKEFGKLRYDLGITKYSEVHPLHNMLLKSTFLPVDGMLEWLQEHYPNEGFRDSEKLNPNQLGHEKFVTEIIIPFLKKTYEIDLFW
jgi:hypothetical protein